MSKMDNSKEDRKITKRNVGLQTIVSTKEYLAPQVAATLSLETEDYPKFINLPHSIAALIVLCGILYYLSRIPTFTIEEGVKMGIIGVIVSVVFLGCLFLPDSFLRRPHPVFWRLVTSAGILYLIFALIILFQSKDQARQFLKFFDKELGKPLPEKNYADKCEITQKEYPYLNLEHFYAAVWDMYMIAHLVGWYVKMLIVRNVKICWFLSILFEILEITFRHWLPNFWECWWDHLILDVFGMNALGIFLGDLTCRFMEMKNYKWINKTTQEKKPKCSSFVSKITNFFERLTPNYYVKHEWDIFSSTKRFFQVVWFFVFMNLVDLSHFFLKFVLWIPQTHDILAVRIYTWGLLAMIGAREYYEYITNPACTRFGLNVWLAHLIVFVEWAYILKFSDGLFEQPFPDYVIYFWTIVFLFISGILIHLITKDLKKHFKKGETEKIVNLLEPEIEVEMIN